MKMSKHARMRMRQRGFSDFSMEIIRQCGRYEKAVGGAEKIFFGNREYQCAVETLKKTIQLLDRAKGGHIVAKDGRILTVYK